MPPPLSALSARRCQLTARVAAVVVASSLLVACASTSDGGGGLGSGLFKKKNPTPGVATVEDKYGPEFFLKSGYCPPVEIRSGAATLVTYERGHEQDQNFLQYQATFTKTARECHAIDADTLSIKVGVAGRVVAGPKGSAGSVTLPMRIAVAKQHGNAVLYTQAFNVPVALAPPDFTAEFSQVFDNIVFDVTEDDRDLIIFVGYDQGESQDNLAG